MKNLIVVLLLSNTTFAQTSLNIYAFPLDASTNKVAFEEVFQAPNLSKDQIFSQLKIWVAENFNSAKAVINMEDKDAGIMKIKAIQVTRREESLTYDDHMHYDLFLYVKDGKYKCVLTNISSEMVTGTKWDNGERMPIEKPYFL